MSLIVWNKNLEVGNATIDSQHEKLVALINRVHASMTAKDKDEVVGKVLSEMIEYTEYHFRFEEGLMNRAGYPLAPAHKIEHTKFVDKVREFQSKFKAGKAAVNVELMFFLSSWLRTHILEEDRKVGEHLARPARSAKPAFSR